MKTYAIYKTRIFIAGRNQQFKRYIAFLKSLTFKKFTSTWTGMIIMIWFPLSRKTYLTSYDIVFGINNGYVQ